MSDWELAVHARRAENMRQLERERRQWGDADNSSLSRNGNESGTMVSILLRVSSEEAYSSLTG